MQLSDLLPVGSNINYKFIHYLTGLEAFMANFEKKVQFIVPGTPVFILNSGDSSYFFQLKWHTSDNAKNEIYQKTPRVVIEFSDVQFQTDQNTNQYNQFQYKLPPATEGGAESVWNAKGRRQSSTMPLELQWVCPNHIYALCIAEVLGSIMCIDNVFTYDVLGNTYQASYQSQTFSLEKGAVTGDSSNINSVVKCTVDLVMQPMLVRYESIQPIADAQKTPVISLIDHNGQQDYVDAINPQNPDDPTLTKNQT